MTAPAASSVAGLRFLALAALLAACPLPAQAADHPPKIAYDQSDTAPVEQNDVVTGQHVEGHIAFLRAELGITPDQESVWKPVADAMREDVREMQDAERQVAHQSHGRENAIQYLQNRTTFANLRAQGEARFLAAMQPLYDALSSHQKQVADDLLISNGDQQP